MAIIYYLVLFGTLFRVFFLGVGNKSKGGSRHFATRMSLMICLAYRAIPVNLFNHDGFTLTWSVQPSFLDVISNGLSLSVITADVVVSRMAGREFHPIIVIITMISIVSNFAILVFSAFYYTIILYEICEHTKLPLLSINRNVYCDGIYDLCHIGHMTAFKNALKFGTRLFVGVCSDEEATPYKRQPIMTTQERVQVVQACKYVYKVIPNAPCKKGDLNEAFLKKHNIHIVAHGEEYDKPDDLYYAVPRRMGITRILPRYQGLSTSELISRIMKRSEVTGKPVKAASD